MSGKNEDSIEKFFRKGVRQNDTTFRESDWLALEKRLEEHAQAQAAARATLLRQMAIGGAGLLLISMSLYFLLPSQASRNAERQSTAHGPQTTVENQTTAHSPQTAIESQTTDHGPQATAESQATVNAKDQSTVHGQHLSRANQESMAKAARQSGGDSKLSGAETRQQSTVDTEKGSTINAERSAVNNTRELKRHARQSGRAVQQAPGSQQAAFTGGSLAEAQTAGVQQTAGNQNTNTTRKPRLLKRSEATAASTPVSPHSIVATASERPARAAESSAAEKQPQTTRPASVAPHTPDVHRTAASPAISTSSDRNTNHTAINSVDGLAHPTDEPSAAQSQSADPAANGAAKAGEASTADSQLDQAKRGQPIVDHSLSTVDRGPSTVDAPSAADTVQADTTARQAPVAKQPGAAEEQKKNDKPRIPSRWNIALVVAPDFSTTGLGDEMTKPGTAFGGMIGYRLSGKFTVVSGVIRSSKKYTGYGKDYTPPEGYWDKRTNGVVPDEIQGSCTVVEVPVNVQFDVWRNQRSRLYIAGGVSSYFMRREAYTYSFNEPNAGADRSWSSNRPSTFALKVGNLSAAYEIMLTKNFGVSVEPYIKIPFQGIGWGNISLYTTGAYINARYFFLRKNLE